MSEITDEQIWEWVESHGCLTSLGLMVWSEKCQMVPGFTKWNVKVTDAQNVEYEYEGPTLRDTLIAAMAAPV